MSRRGKPQKIRRADYDRVLVTETLPYETPVIFSNEGFYKNVRRGGASNPILKLLLNSLVYGRGPAKLPRSTIPFSYQIRRNAFEFRRLSVIHPISQWKIREFYRKHENQILRLCMQSAASIRAPRKIASTFYAKSSWENVHQYKTGGVLEEDVDPFSRFSPSFFAYRGYDRLYKFFDSRDYYELEKSYGFSLTLDVSKCFDSIYTHCLSWSVKDKAFTKKHVSVGSTFAQEFDVLMQHANHRETNGILIGPEVSRVFAEILFQGVDKRAIAKLEISHGLKFGDGYSFRRYVDDLFIFAKSENDARTVYDCYSDVLRGFNLHANTSKSVPMRRPFVTKKSRVIREASNKANEFLEKFTQEEERGSRIVPKRIHYPWRLTRNFISTVKALCSANEVEYDEVASYLISVLTERVKKIANNDLRRVSDEGREQFKDVCLVLLDVLFFLYSVAPSVSASYKVCTSIVVLKRFAYRHLKVHEMTIKQRIFELTDRLLASGAISLNAAVDSFVPLEAINIALATKELGKDYLLPRDTIARLLPKRKKPSYYDIVCVLFYVGKASDYKTVRSKVLKAAESRLSSFSDIHENTEKACLFLDLLSCPHVRKSTRMVWLKRFFSSLGIVAPTDAEMLTFLAKAPQAYWFVDWAQPDLLNSLEKKELKQAY